MMVNTLYYARNLENTPEEPLKFSRKLWQIEDCFPVSKCSIGDSPCFVMDRFFTYIAIVSELLPISLAGKILLYSLKKELGDQVTHGRLCSP